MISGMLEAVNGSLNEELQLSIITNNLANIGVAGFKKDRLSFATELRNQLRDGGETQAANFVQDQQLYRRTVTLEADLSQGTLQHTGNPLDLAISGEAFFKISTPDGIRYTRNGVFHLNEQGMIVTSEGYLVLGENGPINVPEGELVVDERGGVSVRGGAGRHLGPGSLCPARETGEGGSIAVSPEWRSRSREGSRRTDGDHARLPGGG